jgi:hypothetical protein
VGEKLMKIPDEFQRRFETWLREKCSNLKCSQCQSVRWKVGDLLLPAHVDPAAKFGVDEPVMAQLVCKNCAHVVLFDVRAIKGWYADVEADPSKTMIF